jgi:antitoxin component of MazEF toxin-antitoxin module
METAIRKLGNSAGLILPAPLLKSLNLSVGQTVEVEESEGRLVITPKTRKQYALQELLAQCHAQAAPPADMAGWEEMAAVGREAA